LPEQPKGCRPKVKTATIPVKVCIWRGCVLACFAAAVLTGCSHSPKTQAASWDPKVAAVYLDQRETTWMEWPPAARDHETFCISCHTAVPYALSRPVLRKVLAEEAPSVGERKLLDNVTKRVRLWNEVGPFYGDQGYDRDKPAQSRGTEAVLNALILASYDAQAGHLSDTTRAAFTNMWALEETKGDKRGAWPWLEFGMEPWEAKDSQYYGAALAAIAVGTAPENYRSTPDIQDKLRTLGGYLDRGYATQSTINRVVLLWASTKLPGLVDPERQKSIIQEVWDGQQSDGGWKLSALAWPNDWSLRSFVRTRLRADGTVQQDRSDGYATGLITFVLEQAGIAGEDPRLQRGLSWLARNQNKQEGSWPSLSLSQRRNPSSQVGHFMSDAATAYAVLALGEDSSHAVVTSSRLVPTGTRKMAGQAVPSSSNPTGSAASP
jgi:squalene-hopene/tetraprenyl-beta-curcumene cyclase